MKRVLITGAAGFVGAHATSYLLARGYEVHALGRTPPRDGHITFHRSDLLNIDSVSTVVAAVRATHLLHLAWDVTPGRYWQAAENLDWVAASLHLVKGFAAAGGQRAVIAGTCGEYQWGASRFSELATPCLPDSLYGVAKDALRRLVMAYGESIGLSIGWGRIFFLYGPDEKPGRLVSDAIQSLLSGVPFRTSHGHQKRDFLHVDDAASAFAALVDCEVHGPVNIGSGRAVPVRKILRMIAAKTGHPECLRFGERALSANEPEIIEADTSRLVQEVGFEPQYDLASGISETVAWWRCR